MSRYSLKRNRRKALFGIDAAATLAAAAIQSAATRAAAKQQADAITEQAQTQAQSLRLQNENANNLQRESIAFTRQQNKENRDQQNNIQMTLQMLAGQDNMNSRLDRTKVAVKYGGKPKRTKHSPLYGGGIAPFSVTDGGGVIPIDIDGNGYGLYEIIGNDHDHYHKTRGGKYKSGVGIQFPDGSIVEGEGNQNTSRGEKLFVTPNDAMFISKHSINGFNPSDAVDYGMNPQEAFLIQEQLKDANGINDDGSRKRPRLRTHAVNGYDVIMNNVNQTYYPSNNTANVASGIAYMVNNRPPVEGSYDRKYTLKCGGRHRAKNGFWDNYGGATINSAGNLLGAGIGILGNYFAGRTLGKAYTDAGKLLSDAYGRMHGISMSELDRNSFAPSYALAAVRSADTNVNPQLERIRRSSVAERNIANRNTLSSAARQQRLAGINDRMYQRMSEVYATKHNQDEQIAQENANRITNVAQANAQLQQDARREFGNARLNLLQYNNDIENSKIAGSAQALADAMTQRASTIGSLWTSSANMLGTAIANSGSAFAKAHDNIRTTNANYQNILVGADMDSKISSVIMKDDATNARSLYNSVSVMANDTSLPVEVRNKYREYAALLNSKFNFGSNTNNSNVVPQYKIESV